MSPIFTRHLKVALLSLGSAILLFSCEGRREAPDRSAEAAMMTEYSENLSVVMSQNGRRSYFFETPLLEGYRLGAEPYREFRRGVRITTYRDDSLASVDAVLTANYAIYYEKRELWEARGDVVIKKFDGTEVYTQQLFWNARTKKVYSNVDTKLVKGNNVTVGERFESDEDFKDWRFRYQKSRMEVDVTPAERDSTGAAGVPEVVEGDRASRRHPEAAPIRPRPERRQRPAGTGAEPARLRPEMRPMLQREAVERPADRRLDRMPDTLLRSGRRRVAPGASTGAGVSGTPEASTRSGASIRSGASTTRGASVERTIERTVDRVSYRVPKRAADADAAGAFAGTADPDASCTFARRVDPNIARASDRVAVRIAARTFAWTADCAAARPAASLADCAAARTAARASDRVAVRIAARTFARTADCAAARTAARTAPSASGSCNLIC